MTAKVAILMGSDSDWPVMEKCAQLLDDLGIPNVARVLSAHRTPEQARAFVCHAREEGYGVLIAAAGGAAHLAGFAAAHTTLPVIGVPLAGTPLAGVDALYATVQMPPGIPVATVAIGEFGAKNAAVLAAEILAVSDVALAKKLDAYRKQMTEQVLEKDRKLQDQRKK